MLSAINAVGSRLIAVHGTGTEIDLYEIVPTTGLTTLAGTVPGLYEVYVPTHGAVEDDLYLLGFPSLGAAAQLYRVPIDDVASTTSIAVDRDMGDLNIYAP